MADQRVLDYIYKCQEAGYDTDTIRKNLINAGWSSDVVEEALREANSDFKPMPLPYQERGSHPASARNSTDNSETPGTLERLKLSILHPNQLFERVKNEEGYTEPLKFYLVIVIVYAIVGIAATSFVSAFLFPFKLLGIGSMLNALSYIMFVVSAFASIIGTFIGAGILHVFALIFGAKKGYNNTYKAMVYSAGPSLFILPVMFLSIINPVILVGAAAIYILMLALYIKGISRLHEISAVRAFLAIFVPLLIPLMLTAYSAYIMMPFSSGMFNPQVFNPGMSSP